MIMDKSDVTTFPKFAKYVRYSLPTVVDVKSIVAGFAKYGQIDRATLKKALTWGNEPHIVIKPLVDAIGEFDASVDPNIINIETRIVQEFEDGHGLRKNKWGKGVYLVGVTLLHELIHWADNLDGIDFPDEEGEQFERDVYGMVINE
jgi:Metallopeptidase toxin 3